MKDNLRKELEIIASLSDLWNDEQEDMERFIEDALKEELERC